jgi:hypothetical protein
VASPPLFTPTPAPAPAPTVYDPQAARIVEPELEPAMAGGGQLEGADMAALMRELSSLGGGFDSDNGGAANAAPAATHPPRPLPADPKKDKKKKGFFGR